MQAATRSRALITRAAPLCLLASCIWQSVDEETVETKGEHVVVHAAPTIPVCARSIAAADRYLEDVAAMIDAPVPSVSYYLYDGNPHCGTGAYATASCTISGVVYADAWIHYHELVHAVDHSNPPAFFAEGLAVALSTLSEDSRHTHVDRKTAHLALESQEFRSAEPHAVYAVAGDFVRYVIERFGAPRYYRFTRALVSSSDTLAIRAVFGRIYGVHFDDVVADWRVSDPADSTVAVPRDITDCVAPTPPIGVETWGDDNVQPNDCMSGTTAKGTGYIEPDAYGFEVTDPGLFLIHVEAGQDAHGTVRSCAPETNGTIYDYTSSLTEQRFSVAPLAAGRHVLTAVDDTRAWRVSRLGPTGDACDTAPVFTAPPHSPWRLDVRAPALSWIRIDTSHAGMMRATARSASGVFTCIGSCARGQCSVVPSTARIDARHEPVYMRLGGSHDLEGITVLFEDD